MTLALNFAARSDRGLVRGNNEDSAVAACHVVALADGMGGHAAGEVASDLMINALLPLEDAVADALARGADIPTERLVGLLIEAMDTGNRAIAAHVDENPTLEGMGCTLTSLLFDGDRLGVCHVGDSRGYLLRDGDLEQITKDDTFVQSLVDEGRLAPEDVSSHPQRSLILKALTGRPVDPTTQVRKAVAGDRYMLCSDGLSDPVSADTIRDVLSTGTPDEAATKLIDLALRGGGPDNVTVVVVDVVDPEAPGSPELPTVPALAGAVDLNADESPRPDTAAGRAARVNIVRRAAGETDGEDGGTTPDDAAEEGATSVVDAPGGPGADDGDGRRKRRRHRRMLTGLTAVVVVLVVLAGAGWLIRHNLNDSYFVAVADADDIPAAAVSQSEAAESAAASASTAAGAAPSAAPSAAPGEPADPSSATGPAKVSGSASSLPSSLGAAAEAAAHGTPIMIYQGSPSSFLGISLQSAYQEVCLDDKGSVRLLPAGSDDSCHRFSTSDLTPAARGTLDNLPRDSYEEVQSQVRRLAEQTLPACVTRDGGRPDDPDGADHSDADLTTPGVSCREVG
jgi:serine/threonine protein phosphatase PrpC